MKLHAPHHNLALVPNYLQGVISDRASPTGTSDEWS